MRNLESPTIESRRRQFLFMSNRFISPERLFDRPWQAGHPFRPRLSSSRRWGMTLLFFLLCSIIGGYWYLTDSRRVRAMAESYLSQLLGGPVHVGRATLSIFEGLRLDNIQVRVDESDAADSLIFSADTFLIQYNPRALLQGRLEAGQIVAVDPLVRLTANIDTGEWNYQRLARNRSTRFSPMASGRKLVLPQVILRNAQVRYSEIFSGELRPLGSIDIEGQLSPGLEAGWYTFMLQSRGASEGIGPVVSGSVGLRTGQINARLKNFEFGRDIKTMLPAEVRDWWEQHELAGRIDIPELSYTPAGKNQKAAFKVETDLNGVTLAVDPRQWLSRPQNLGLQNSRASLSAMRLPGLSNPTIARLISLVKPSPIRLRKVAGTFIFTQDGIDVKEVHGRVENNAFKVNGRIEGYSPEAPVNLRVASLDSEHIYIPHSPRYINSMPPQVREIYERLRPEGTCAVWVELKRTAPGERPQVSGEINVIDGAFIFKEFPYPLRGATGKISFGHDPVSGIERVDIRSLRGRGIEGGPNQNSFIVINGWIGPFDRTLGINVRVKGENITSEPPLRKAFPKEVQQVLRVLGEPQITSSAAAAAPISSADEPGYPTFHGSFVCDVILPIGYRSRLTINTDITLTDAAGRLAAFPYPMRHLTGQLRIRPGYVDLVKITMTKKDANIIIDGRVNFGRDEPLKPDLKITAHNLLIDKDLLEALPADRRGWLENLGLEGKLDIQGRVGGTKEASPGSRGVRRGRKFLDFEQFLLNIKPPIFTIQRSTINSSSFSPSSLDYEFQMSLHDGTVWPADGTFAISDLSGKLRLTPWQIELTDLKARRGQADLSGSGTISWPENHPQAMIHAKANNLSLDAGLYQMLPPPARKAWDEVGPQGTLDAELSYEGEFSAIEKNQKRPRLELILRPKELSATLAAAPYRLDNIAGVVAVTQGVLVEEQGEGDEGPGASGRGQDEIALSTRVILKDLTARHGEATIALAGTGTIDGAPAWNIQLNGQNVAVDDDLLKALPETLSGLMQSLKLQGKINFDFSKLLYSPGKETEPNISFAGRMGMNQASLDVGVPLTQVDGTLDLAGSISAGRLADLTGAIDLSSLLLADRSTKNFRADLFKPPDQPLLRLANMRAELAGGEMAGQVDLAFPQDGPSRYAIAMDLRNVDVRELARQTEKEIRGQLSASLALEGSWSDPASRRGRGDVLVSGKEMYKIPFVLGLLQVTNLSLPITSPFSEATMSYSIDGQRVIFEKISLRSKEMMMQGSGHLDFDTKKVKLSFTTDNPNWPKLPIISDFLDPARNELLRIHVNGTLEEPKVSADSLNTLTTTVDEVFRGQEK